MKIVLISEKQTSRVTFKYQKLSEEETNMILQGLETTRNCYRQLNNITAYKRYEELLEKIRKES